MTTQAPPHGDGGRPRARQRLLDAAYRLFYADGIHAVGVDRLLSEASVTRATMYKQFSGKEGLVLAYLGHEDEILRQMFEAARTAAAPATLLDATIAGIAEDITGRHTRGCPFINAAAEYPDPGPVRDLIAAHRRWFRATLASIAATAGLRSPNEVAASLVLLRDAALVGGYLDGAEEAGPAFVRTARLVCAAYRAA